MITYLVYKVFHPLSFLIILGIGLYWRRKTVSQWSKFAFVLAFLVFSNPWLVQQCIADFESMHLPPNPKTLEARAYTILVLGSGKNDDRRLSTNQRLSETALARLVEGVKWARIFPEANLIGSGPVGQGDKSQARLMIETAAMLGIAPHRLYGQEDVHNTYTEALAYVRQFGTDTPLILCTSALHLPRAVRFFQAAGVKEIIPAPANFMAPQGPITYRQWIPSLKSFDLWQAYGKERIGYHVPEFWFGK